MFILGQLCLPCLQTSDSVSLMFFYISIFPGFYSLSIDTPSVRWHPRAVVNFICFMHDTTPVLLLIMRQWIVTCSSNGVYFFFYLFSSDSLIIRWLF